METTTQHRSLWWKIIDPSKLPHSFSPTSFSPRAERRNRGKTHKCALICDPLLKDLTMISNRQSLAVSRECYNLAHREPPSRWTITLGRHKHTHRPGNTCTSVCMTAAAQRSPAGLLTGSSCDTGIGGQHRLTFPSPQVLPADRLE